MFEKEAKEYCNTLIQNKIKINDIYDIEVIQKDLEKLFQDGAEFGYNKAKEDSDKMKSRFLELCNLKDMRIKELEKANEWHYVKDGYLPKDMENVLINAFDYGINTCYVAHRLNGKWKSNCSSEIFVHVIAWKEIVLPELPKESK